MSAMSNWLASFVVNAAWQIAVVTLVAMLSARLLRRTPSRYAHAIWVIALAACLAVPLIALLVQIRDAGGVTANAPIPTGAMRASQSMDGRMQVSFRSFSRPVFFPAPLIRVLLWAYIFSLLLRGAQLSWASYRTGRVRGRAFPRAIPLRLSRAVELCRRRFTARGVAILCTKDANGPATMGMVRPILILPESFFDDDSEEADLMCALSHEFAHIGRRDFLMNVIYQMAYVPMCFHPCTALIMARIAQTRELACDEMAATMMPSPKHYAQSLLQIARSVLSGARKKPNYALGLFDTNELEKRVMNILAMTKSNSEWTRTKKWTSICLLAAGCLALSAFSFRVAPGINGAELARVSFTMNRSKSAGIPSQSTDAKAETSGTFHLSEIEPTKHLALRGKTGIVKVKNIGPAGLVVKNSQNNVTLGANSQFNLTFEGDTDLSISRAGQGHYTDGTFEIIVNQEQ